MTKFLLELLLYYFVYIFVLFFQLQRSSFKCLNSFVNFVPWLTVWFCLGLIMVIMMFAEHSNPIDNNHPISINAVEKMRALSRSRFLSRVIETVEHNGNGYRLQECM